MKKTMIFLLFTLVVATADAQRSRRAIEKTNSLAARGEAALRQGDIQEARQWYERSRHSEAITTRSICLGASIALKEHDLARGAALLDRAIYFNPRDTMAYIRYALLMAKRQPDSVIVRLKRLIALTDNNTEAKKKLALVYYQSNRFDSAAAVYGGIAEGGDTLRLLNANELVNYDMALFMTKNFNASLSLAKLCRRQWQRNTVFNRLIFYNLTDLKRYDEAVTAAYSFFHESDATNYQYLDYIYYGYALKGAGQTDDAIRQFKKALSSGGGKRSDVVESIAMAFNEIGEWDQAIDYYKQYMAMLKDTSDYVYYQLARLYYNKGSDKQRSKELTAEKRDALNEADRLMERVTADYPENISALLLRARVNAVCDPDITSGVAIPYYEKLSHMLLEKGSTDERLMECCRYLAYYHFQKGDNSDSMRYADIILRYKPDDTLATNIKNSLEPE